MTLLSRLAKASRRRWRWQNTLAVCAVLVLLAVTSSLHTSLLGISEEASESVANPRVSGGRKWNLDSPSESGPTNQDELKTANKSPSGRANLSNSPLPKLVPSENFFSTPSKVTTLRDVDKEFYTIRIVSWKRAPFLAASVAHHSACPGVKQIQVVWSVLQEDQDKNSPNDTSSNNPTNNNTLPDEVVQNPKVVIEKRQTDRLTDRFDILPSTPTETLGILNMDDDLLYPCDALEMGFFLWTLNPDRMVTYAPRRHYLSNPYAKRWKYGYYWNNQYSLGLTSTAFLHRDYLFQFTHYLPRPIYHHIQQHRNCEDLAMSVLVSSLTDGKFPLAVDEWGITSRVQMAWKTGYQGLKEGDNHMSHRSNCTDWYAAELGLKEKFLPRRYARLKRLSTFDGLDIPSFIRENPRFISLEQRRRAWLQLNPNDFQQRVVKPMRKILQSLAEHRNISHEGHG